MKWAHTEAASWTVDVRTEGSTTIVKRCATMSSNDDSHVTYFATILRTERDSDVSSKASALPDFWINERDSDAVGKRAPTAGHSWQAAASVELVRLGP